MNEDDLKRILARNPGIRAEDRFGFQTKVTVRNPAITVERDDEDKPSRLYLSCGQVPPPEPERGEAHALDPVVQGEAASQVRPRIRFTFYRVRLVDADARAHGCKDMLDGLVEAGLIPGDREDQIDFQEPRQFKVHYKKDERTEIELTLT